jgi:hypothetical protein
MLSSASFTSSLSLAILVRGNTAKNSRDVQTCVLANFRRIGLNDRLSTNSTAGIPLEGLVKTGRTVAVQTGQSLDRRINGEISEANGAIRIVDENIFFVTLNSGGGIGANRETTETLWTSGGRG